jgi:hypothetical protein
MAGSSPAKHTIIIKKNSFFKEKNLKFFKGHFKNICGFPAYFPNNFA